MGHLKIHFRLVFEIKKNSPNLLLVCALKFVWSEISVLIAQQRVIHNVPTIENGDQFVFLCVLVFLHFFKQNHVPQTIIGIVIQITFEKFQKSVPVLRKRISKF